MSGLLWAVLGASFLGSLHCAGMCGPFAWLASSAEPDKRRSPWPALGAYHGSRLVLYSSLGVLAGGVGFLVDLGGAAAGLQRGAALLGGSTLIVYAILRLFSGQRWLVGGWIANRISNPLTGWLAQARLIRGWQRAALIGVVSSLMPCGWLYAFVLAAAATGDPLTGAALMTTFWLGTVPTLALLVFGMGRIARPIAARVPAILAVAALLIGVYTVATRNRLDLSGQASAISLSEAASYVRSIEQEKLPCCAHPVEQE